MALPIEMKSAMNLVSEDLQREPSSELSISPSASNILDPSKDNILLDWDIPEDTGNPKNWSLGKRIFHTAIPAFYGFTV